MDKVETKLFAWHHLYVKLEHARSRLKALRATAEGSPGQRELEAEVSRLQEESDSELDAVNAAVAATKQPGSRANSLNRLTGAADSTR